MIGFLRLLARSAQTIAPYIDTPRAAPGPPEDQPTTALKGKSMATEKGIAITIKGFIHVDPKDLAGHRKALDAAMEAQTGNLAPLQEMMILEGRKAEPVTRRKRDDAPTSNGQE